MLAPAVLTRCMVARSPGTGCTFVRGGDARLGVEHLARARPFDLLFHSRLRQRGEHRQVRRLHDEAVGSLAIRN